MARSGFFTAGRIREADATYLSWPALKTAAEKSLHRMGVKRISACRPLLAQVASAAIAEIFCVILTRLDARSTAYLRDAAKVNDSAYVKIEMNLCVVPVPKARCEKFVKNASLNRG